MLCTSIEAEDNAFQLPHAVKCQSPHYWPKYLTFSQPLRTFAKEVIAAFLPENVDAKMEVLMKVILLSRLCRADLDDLVKCYIPT